jgi:predicted pyridoxine 5'-phosphate oxidase superfamily flavin-nucleotide-binding protein
MTSVYHPGEIAVQERAGVADQAARLGHGIRTTMLPVAQEFLRQQRFAVLGGVDAGERVWASLLTGEPGFLAPEGEGSLRVHALPADGDPLAGRVELGGLAGLLAIDLANRKRLRVNGEIGRAPGGFALRTREVFFNCPKYIQAREQEELDVAALGAPSARRGCWWCSSSRRWARRPRAAAA